MARMRWAISMSPGVTPPRLLWRVLRMIAVKALIVRYDERPQPAVYLFGSRRALVAAMSEDNLATWRRMLRQDNQDVWLAGQADALDALGGFLSSGAALPGAVGARQNSANRA